VNGDGQLNAEDRTVVGNAFPDFIYGLSGTVAYRGIDLGFALQGVQGNQVLNLFRRYGYNIEGNFNNLERANVAGAPPTTPATGAPTGLTASPRAGTGRFPPGTWKMALSCASAT
jgi:hypothetical protein